MGRKPNSEAKKVEKSHMPESSTPVLNGETSQFEMQMNVAGLASSSKRAKNQTVVVRRSGRIQSAFQSARSNDIEPMIQHIDDSEGEKEDGPLVPEQDVFPEPTQNEKSLEEKLDFILERLEAQQETLEALKSKRTETSFMSKDPCATDIRYKKLYFESQNKIETLKDEISQLSKKLEYALGKIEVYEKNSHVVSEALEKVKDVIMISNMTKATKATEAAINLSSQAILGCHSSRNAEPKTLPAKRKKREKGIKEIA